MAIARATDTSGDVYLGGGFTTYNSSASNYIIRLNANGSVDTLAPARDGSGDIYIEGGFTSYQTTTASYIIALNPNGSID